MPHLSLQRLPCIKTQHHVSHSWRITWHTGNTGQPHICSTSNLAPNIWRSLSASHSWSAIGFFSRLFSESPQIDYQRSWLSQFSATRPEPGSCQATQSQASCADFNAHTVETCFHTLYDFSSHSFCNIIKVCYLHVDIASSILFKLKIIYMILFWFNVYSHSHKNSKYNNL